MTKTAANHNGATTAAPPTLIESDEFPFEFLSSLAQRESWRKEVYRPVYHVHKWWAKRLGSIFRGIILGSLLPPASDLSKAFYEPHDFSGVTVNSQFFALLGRIDSPDAAADAFRSCGSQLDHIARKLCRTVAKGTPAACATRNGQQLSLFSPVEG